MNRKVIEDQRLKSTLEKKCRKNEYAKNFNPRANHVDEYELHCVRLFVASTTKAAT